MIFSIVATALFPKTESLHNQIDTHTYTQNEKLLEFKSRKIAFPSLHEKKNFKS